MSALEESSSQVPQTEISIEQRLSLVYTEIAQSSFEIARTLGSVTIQDTMMIPHMEPGSIENKYQDLLAETYFSITRQSLEVAVKFGNLAVNEYDTQESKPGAQLIELPGSKPIGETIALSLLDLTRREREMLEHVSNGLSNRAIADLEYVTEQTVKFHLSNAYRKLGVSNRTKAAKIYDDLLAGKEVEIQASEQTYRRRLTPTSTNVTRTIEFLKSHIGQPLTYRDIGKEVFAGRSTDIGYLGTLAYGIICQRRSFFELLASVGIHLETYTAGAMEGFEHLNPKTAIIIPQITEPRQA